MKKQFTVLFLIILFFNAAYGMNLSFELSHHCQGDTVLLINTSTPADSISSTNWDLDGDGQFNNNSGDSIQHIFQASGTINIGMQIVTLTGDSLSLYKSVVIFEAPDASFSLSNGCLGDTFYFYNTSSINNDSIINYLWNFGDGWEGIIMDNPKHVYDTAGIFTVKLTALSTHGCSSYFDDKLEVFPAAEIHLSFEGDTLIYKGQSFTVIASGTFDQILWSDGSTSNQLTITQSGMYTAIASLGNCESQAAFSVEVFEMPELLVHNILTPNNDGINDLWIIENLDLYESVEVAVYNAWGKEVYQSGDYQNNWDGSGLPTASYYYILKPGNSTIIKGSVTIIK